jgi:hypothetical protein
MPRSGDAIGDKKKVITILAPANREEKRKAAAGSGRSRLSTGLGRPKALAGNRSFIDTLCTVEGETRLY